MAYAVYARKWPRRAMAGARCCSGATGCALIQYVALSVVAVSRIAVERRMGRRVSAFECERVRARLASRENREHTHRFVIVSHREARRPDRREMVVTMRSRAVRRCRAACARGRGVR